MQEVFQAGAPGCFAALRSDDMVGFISHAPDNDIESFRDAFIYWQWELVRMPTAPLIRFHAYVLDNPYNPYQFEHFPQCSRSGPGVLALAVSGPRISLI